MSGPSRVDAEAVERDGAAAVRAAEGHEADLQRTGERRGVVPWPIAHPGRAVVGRELADDVRARRSGRAAARAAGSAPPGAGVMLDGIGGLTRAALGDDVLELVVAAARLDRDELA